MAVPPLVSAETPLAAVEHRLHLAAQVGEPRLAFDQHFPSWRHLASLPYINNWLPFSAYIARRAFLFATTKFFAEYLFYRHVLQTSVTSLLPSESFSSFHFQVHHDIRIGEDSDQVTQVVRHEHPQEQS